MKCSICGKEVKIGYTIIGNRVLCRECGTEYDELVAELTAELLEAKILGNKPDLKKIINEERLGKFKPLKAFIKRDVLTSYIRHAK